MKQENISRFKEALLVLGFLLLLFSFSGKNPRIVKSQTDKAETHALSKTNVFSAPLPHSLRIKTNSLLVSTPLLFADLDLRRSPDYRAELSLYFSKQQFIRDNPRRSARFYYWLFAQQDELPA